MAIREGIELLPRPNSIRGELVPVQVIEASKEVLERMSDQELDDFLWNYFGIAPRTKWNRTTKITFIMRSCVSIKDND